MRLAITPASVINISEMQSVLIILTQDIAMIFLLSRLLLPVAQTVLHLFNSALSNQKIPVSDFSLADKRVFFDFVPIFF